MENPTLNDVEARILGVLIEKALTTPDQYPLSLNAIRNGCNQKSNRDQHRAGFFSCFQLNELKAGKAWERSDDVRRRAQKTPH